MKAGLILLVDIILVSSCSPVRKTSNFFTRKLRPNDKIGSQFISQHIDRNCFRQKLHKISIYWYYLGSIVTITRLYLDKAGVPLSVTFRIK